MSELNGYLIKETLYMGEKTLVYRGVRKQDETPVIIKTLRSEYPDPKTVAQFHHEYEITHDLDLNGIVKTLDFQQQNNQFFMIFEDIEGDSLKTILEEQKLDLDTFLQIAIELAQALGELHSHNIIHKDIKPANIIVNLTNKVAKITDFSISSRLSLEEQEISNPDMIEGTLTYMSPEQTGRMNRSIDYRSDFYSLGIVFYEMLVGYPPFQTEDSIELVHCHIAKLPLPPRKSNPDIPKVISHIVMKLLAKTAEARYQSAYGLKADLQACLQQLEATGQVDEFNCGEKDVSDRFQIPQKLYGRETEIETLLKAFQRINQGRSEMILVSGYSGIGKTSLVQEIYKPITQQRGYLISGKFDQYQRNVPYSAMIKAFQDLIRQLLTEEEHQLKKWQEKISQALGKNAQVIIDVIPDIEMIIGEQPEVPDLPPTESQNRFNILFENFIRVFTRRDSPLVIFLDDLQWADTSSLKLIQLLMTDSDNHYLLFIGTYRDNEVSASHPLMLTLEDIKKSGTFVHHIALSPLILNNINQLLTDTLSQPLEKTKPLAELVLTKTQGNPFFIEEFLKSLYSDKLLNFSYQLWSWQWDLTTLQMQDFTDNVVDLMTDKIRHLPQDTQEILQLAACIGNQFDLKTLSVVSQKTPLETLKALRQALQDRLIIPLQYNQASLINYQLSMELNDPQQVIEQSTMMYKFGHDRIQQAAYQLIPENQRQVVHQKIGHLLLENTPDHKKDEKLFDIVNQLNLAVDIIDSSQAEELAHINLVAGKKAQAAAAYETAFKYFNTGRLLLPADKWQYLYDLTLALTVETLEATYLNGDFEEMEYLSKEVLHHANNTLDIVKVYEIKIHAFISQNQLSEALSTALFALRLLGVRFPENPKNYHIWWASLRTKSRLAGKDISHLKNLPLMTQPKKLAIMRLLASAVMPAMLTMPKLFALIVFKLINFSVKYGHSPVSPYAYASYGTFLCATVGDINTGYQFGQLALVLVDKMRIKEMRTRILVIYNAFIRHTKEHVNETLPYLLEAYNIGIETGDLEFTARSVSLYSYYSYLIGHELSQVEEKMNKYTYAIKRLRQAEVLIYVRLFHQAVLNLMSDTQAPWLLEGECYDEDKMSHLLKESNKTAKCYYHFNKLMLCYLFYEYSQAVEHSLLTEQYLDSVTGLLIMPWFYFYDSLAQLAIYHNVHKFQQEVILKKVQSNQRRLYCLAQHAPENFLHKYHLVAAERYRILGEESKAMDAYDKAIDLAKRHYYLNEEALAFELATKFYLEHDKLLIAKTYFRETSYCYLKWGATRKIKDLESRYPQLKTLSEQQALPETNNTRTYTLTTTTENKSSFDVMSIMKASQTLSGEIVLDRLLQKLIQIVMENVGAQTAWFFSYQDSQLMSEAHGHIQDGQVQVILEKILIDSMEEDSPPLAKSVVTYVARTQMPIVLSDARDDDLFANDTYVIETQPKSILCVPIIHINQMVGVIYLENNLTTGIFTPERLIIIKLLSSQIAISLENALFYEKLENSRYEEERAKMIAERARQAAETASRAKSTFLAKMSHELRTPLNAILGYADMIAEEAEENEYPEVLPDLHRIQAAGKQLLNIISDILNITKIEADKLEFHPQTFQLTELIEDVLSTMQPIIQTDGNWLVTTFQPEDNREMYADYHKVLQIILNILNNASRFTNNGEIRLTVTPTLRHKKEWIIFIIADQGIGISEEYVEQIFEPFMQADNSSTRAYDGTGLGLTISKQFCQAMGGFIHVDSEMGVGSTFSVYLPLDTE